MVLVLVNVQHVIYFYISHDMTIISFILFSIKIRHLGTGPYMGTILLQCQYAVRYEIARHIKYQCGMRLRIGLVWVLYDMFGMVWY